MFALTSACDLTSFALNSYILGMLTMIENPWPALPFPVSPEIAARSRMLPTANFEAYRQLLERDLGVGSGRVAWIVMNPSVACIEYDDMTVRKIMKYSRKFLGARNVAVLNVMDLRDPKPVDLLARMNAGVPVCSSENLPTIQRELEGADKIVAAWGDVNPAFSLYLSAVVNHLRSIGRTIHCLGKTKDGMPKHPSRAEYIMRPAIFMRSAGGPT